MIFSIHVTGLGGQGVVTLTSLLARYTEGAGFKTTIFTSKGMAQRGGRVTSDIRICDDPAAEFDPRIAAGGADILVGMEIGEAINSRDRLRAGESGSAGRAGGGAEGRGLAAGLAGTGDRVRAGGPGGLVLLYEQRIVPTTVVLDKSGYYPSVEEACEVFRGGATGTSSAAPDSADPDTQRVLLIPRQDEAGNVFVLGALCAALPAAGAFFSLEAHAFEPVLRAGLRRNVDGNIQAYMRGYDYGRKIADRA